MKKISEKSQEFIRHFGEMGNRWGINRTVGQIYALLYLSKKPLEASEISDILELSRSNVGIGLKEIEAMNIVKISHIPGSRSDYYEVPDDIWEIVRNLIEYRKTQEIDPTLSILRNLLSDVDRKEARKYEMKKMKEMYKTIDLVNDWYGEMKEVDSDQLIKLFRIGKKVLKVFDIFKKK